MVTPIRLFNSDSPVTLPVSSCNTSKTENGRRSSGLLQEPTLTITNCPGFARIAMSGAARARTL